MPQVICKVESCEYNYNKGCIKSTIEIEDKEIESNYRNWEEQVCRDYTGK